MPLVGYGFGGGNDTMDIKKSILTGIAALLLAIPAYPQIVDTYQFTMRLYVPRVYDNMQSLGYRRYQYQLLRGELLFIYADSGETLVKVKDLENRTHKIGGKRVTYECSESPYDDNGVLTVGVGSNKTLKFTQSGVKFSFMANPSYNIGGLEEDNTLILNLSGHGTLKKDTIKTIRGSVTGQIGCGCYAYGHVSPTRLYLGYLTNIVMDIAPVDGRFTARFKGRYIGPYDIGD